MEENNIIINQVDPTTFEYQQYTEQDNFLISSSRYDTAFSSSIDYIEYYAYDGNKNLIFPNLSDNKVYNQLNYKVINGDVLIDPVYDLEDLGYDQGTFYSTYNFYRKRLGSDITVNYYISEISSDRTELRLKSTAIPFQTIITSSNEFIEYRETQPYFVDFLLNFGGDQQVIANNIQLDTKTEKEPSVLIKLYEALPPNFDLKDTLWVVEELSTSQAYEITFPPIVFQPDDFQYIQGPNYSIQVTQQTGESGQEFNFDTLVQSNITSSYQQLKNILDRKEINISVDYTDYNNFIYFSSALTRLENFYYKAGLIESSSNAIAALPTDSATYSASKAELTTSIQNIIQNFDGYEYFLYFNSGSEYSYPKSNTEPPYTLYSTGSSEVLNWLGSADPNNAYYGGQALSASNYDVNNQNYLYYSIPEYLRDDSANQKYILFVDMVAQQYDNSWQYIKNITTRFDADNRLDYGISKDLVADAIRDFGVKLYSNNFNTNDLYAAFLGITPSGSTFPLPAVTSSYPAPSGFEYVDTQISGSDNIIPLDDANKRLYKRIYHNLPYLLKTKGTLSGIRALITSYGIPSTILRVNEFGGKDRNNFRDWDYSENVFNYALHLDGVESRITSSFIINSDFQNVNTAPRSLQFRFKTPGIPTASAYYNVWVGDANRCFITLEYTGSGLDSGSYSGSIPSESNAYGTLKLYPDGTVDTSVSASIDAPFFDGGWWSVMATIDYDVNNTASLYAANRIGDNIGFSQSAFVGATTQYWKTTSTSSLPSASALTIDGTDHHPLTGALQEVRYWDIPLSESLFYDYVVNPYSTQGNTINSTPDDLVFRAALGTTLDTGSRTSIHPKVTGSWATTSSFVDGTSGFYLTGSWIQNTESIYLNQVPGGIKNRISDKIKIDQEVLPTGSTLSPYRSIQQSTYPSGSSPSINYLEVAFSPTDQVNDDIIAQIGAFNLGDYIGDPRQISQSGVVYPELDALRDAYFTKYIKNYDVNDFIRLIKFLDNSLFKMIEDFTPARTSLSSGVVVKQNLLERNRQAPPSMSYSEPMYSGSVKSFARDYQVPNSNKNVTAYAGLTPGSGQDALASSSYPQYSTISGSSIEVFYGGTGGVFEPYNSIYAAPISASNTEICMYKYSYTSSTEVLLPNTESGTWLLTNVDASNSTNTMSINVVGGDLQNNAALMAYVSASSAGQVNYITAQNPSNEGDYITWRIDRAVFYGGYGDGDSVYQDVPWGDFTSQYQFYLTVTDNSLNPAAGNYPNLTDESIWDICFEIAGEPYSGETAASVSASALFSQYPDYQQAWTESIVPGLGITPAYQTQHSSSNSLPPVTYRRYDQREFYNGEFGDVIQVGAKDVCSAFFGQNDIIDYFFRIQWFDQTQFDEATFLSEENLPLAGNVWLWYDSTVPNPKIKYIKISNVDTNGVSILPFIIDSSYLTLYLTGAQDYEGNLIQGFQTWYISNVSVQDDNNPFTENATLIIVNQEPSSDAITSYDTAFYDLSFSASGIYAYYATSSGEDPTVLPTTGISASIPQGYFPPTDRSPDFSTESFFRGWGKSNYFQTNADGTVYRVTTGSGFSTDTLGNFNTGSLEQDNDGWSPYTASQTPWFTNAPAATIMALSASSLTGGVNSDDLQLFTGSFTASVVDLGMRFITASTPTPVDANLPVSPIIVIPPAGTLLTYCSPGMTSFAPTGNIPLPLQIDCTNNNVEWTLSIQYIDGNGWVVPNTTSGTGDYTVYINVENAGAAGGNYVDREARVYITNDANPANNFYCQIRQYYWDGGTGGGGGGIPPNIP